MGDYLAVAVDEEIQGAGEMTAADLLRGFITHRAAGTEPAHWIGDAMTLMIRDLLEEFPCAGDTDGHPDFWDAVSEHHAAGHPWVNSLNIWHEYIGWGDEVPLKAITLEQLAAIQEGCAQDGIDEFDKDVLADFRRLAESALGLGKPVIGASC